MGTHCVSFLYTVVIVDSSYNGVYLCVCSMYLFRLGLAPQIQDLYGKVEFTGNSLVPHISSQYQYGPLDVFTRCVYDMMDIM